LQRIIVNQEVTRQYLIEHHFCTSDLIELIPGAVLAADLLTQHSPPRQYYGRHKPTFDICFVAQRYTQYGVDKGYDVFIEVAMNLAKRYRDIRFHVVGTFDSTVLDVSALGDQIIFYGSKNTSFFPSFYSWMDLILSPNVPFVLQPGAFDGFPTGCCMEAGLCGVPVFCTDPLGENQVFRDGEEIVIIPHHADRIAAMVEHYYSNHASLYQIGERGQRAFQKLLAVEAQVRPRLRLLSACMEHEGAKGRHLQRESVPDPDYLWWTEFWRAKRDIASLVPGGHKFIFVDECQWVAGQLFGDRVNLPFTEHAGQYWGPPADDPTAIQECERLRDAGAEFLVFGKPAFWWLDHYSGFSRYLRTHFRCVLENARVVAFDLRAF
jgi:hypothetical protein